MPSLRPAARPAVTRCRRGASSAWRRRDARAAGVRRYSFRRSGDRPVRRNAARDRAGIEVRLARPASPDPGGADADGRAPTSSRAPMPSSRSRCTARASGAAASTRRASWRRHLGRPMLDALVRSRATPSQADLPAARRHANVRGAFVLRRRARCARHDHRRRGRREHDRGDAECVRASAAGRGSRRGARRSRRLRAVARRL